jgi:hypothetical protein
MVDLRRVIALALRQWGEQGSRCASAGASFAVAVIPFTRRNYHITLDAAAVRLRFFSGVLRTQCVLGLRAVALKLRAVLSPALLL